MDNATCGASGWEFQVLNIAGWLPSVIDQLHSYGGHASRCIALQ
jgi:hypothetical protein